jgi:ribosomal protein L40E
LPFCSRCGSSLPESANFCPKCGWRTELGAQAGVAEPWESMKQAFATAGREMEQAFRVAGKKMEEAFARAEKELREAFGSAERTVACPKCGEKNPLHARFCGSCGNRLA